MSSLRNFPNLEAVYMGTISGAFRDWPMVRREMRDYVDQMERQLAERDKDAEQYRWAVENVPVFKEAMEEAWNALKEGK